MRATSDFQAEAPHPVYISLREAMQLTALPQVVIRALADSGIILAKPEAGELYVGKVALLGWCRLYSRILPVAVKRHARGMVGGTLNAENLVLLTRGGFFKGKGRVRL